MFAEVSVLAGGNAVGEMAGTGVVDGSLGVGAPAGVSAEGVTGGNAMLGSPGTGDEVDGLVFNIGADARLDLYQV